LLLALLAAPFWEAKDPSKWTEEELDSMFTHSPWARDIGTQLYLASAQPMIDAEEQRRLRHSRKPGLEAPPAAEDDWREYLATNRGKHIVIAVKVQDQNVLAEAEEVRRMEKDSALRVGKKKIRMTGHFPPTPSDPYLRLLFPRVAEPGAKQIRVELYLPGVTMPFRGAEFDLKEMSYRGKVEF